MPAWLAFSVIRLLEEHFSRLVDYEFTASMEDVLDEIAGGRRDRNTELAEFYFGSGDVDGLQKLVSELGDIDARELATFPVADGRRPAGRPLRPLHRGRRGRQQPARNVPEDLPPDELTVDEGQGAAGQPGRRGDAARRGPGDRADHRGEERPLRPLRHRGAARGRAQGHEAAHRRRCSSR